MAWNDSIYIKCGLPHKTRTDLHAVLAKIAKRSTQAISRKRSGLSDNEISKILAQYVFWFDPLQASLQASSVEPVSSKN